METKSKKKKIPKSVNEMSKEMLQETLKKKKECNAKALQTVEKLCEVEVTEEWFLSNLQFINQTHFDDVTVERAISKLCGYPLCRKKLEKIPTQQYHISTRYNKVFDITERKNFCSNTCYKSATHIKNQLFTSPLWFRDQEVIPKYAVLKSEKSSLGEEVVFYPERAKPEVEDIKKKEVDSVKVVKKKDVNNVKDIKKEEVEDGKDLKKNVKLDGVDDLTDKCSKLVLDSKDKVETIQLREENKENVLDQNISPTCGETDIKSEKAPVGSKDKKPKKTSEDGSGVVKVEKSIFEWFSLDSIFYLYGDDKLRELFSDKVDQLKQVLNSKLKLAGSNEKIDKMIQLYGLLDTDSFNRNQVKANLKPLPDYSALKEEGKTLEIKVKAFYQGQLEVKQTKEEEKKEETTNDDNPVYLPLIDAHAQISLRRKIVLDKLNRVLPDLIKIYNSDYTLQMSEVRNLVSTFTLAADNITFKPSDWYLVGIILIKLLSLKDKHLQSVIETEFSVTQTNVVLTSFKLEEDYLDGLIKRLTDPINLLEKVNEINR